MNNSKRKLKPWLNNLKKRSNLVEQVKERAQTIGYQVKEGTQTLTEQVKEKLDPAIEKNLNVPPTSFRAPKAIQRR